MGGVRNGLKSTSKGKGELKAPLSWGEGRAIDWRAGHTQQHTPGLAPSHPHALTPPFASCVLNRFWRECAKRSPKGHSHMSNLKGVWVLSLRRPLISGQTMHPRSGLAVWCGWCGWLRIRGTASERGARGVPCEVRAPHFGWYHYVRYSYMGISLPLWATQHGLIGRICVVRVFIYHRRGGGE